MKETNRVNKQPSTDEATRESAELEPIGKTDGGSAPSAAPSLDLSEYRISQNYAEQIGVKKVLTTVPVRKPDRQWFFRVHPDEAWRMPVAILDLREDRETYLVHPPLVPHLTTEVVLKVLMTAINRQGVLFF